LLTDVLYKLSDTSVPGAQKVSLVEGATVDDAGKFDQFGKALQDSGYTPLSFTADGMAWSDSTPGNVVAQITVHSESPGLARGYTYPMEFKPSVGTWQLSRQTADILLNLGNGAAASPAPTPPR
jgi:hypothetical protein